MIGEVVNGYKILRQLGEGGMAVVYYAENNLGKPFAVKALKEEYTHNPDLRKRFRQEADIMLTLNDIPEIRKVEDFIELPDGSLILVMEYLDGMTLKEYVGKNGVIRDYDFIRNLSKQVLSGLNEAYRTHQIIHRDIKPSNLFLTQKGEVKILDFGISKMLFGAGEEGTEKETTTRQQMGTLSYMSPEQIKCTAKVDYRTDIYSFGATLYYLITGNDPLEMEEDTLNEIQDEKLLFAIKHATRKNVEKRTPTYDRFMEEIIKTRSNVLKIDTRIGGTILSELSSIFQDKIIGNDKKGEGQNTASSKRTPKTDSSSKVDFGTVFLLITVLVFICGVVLMIFSGEATDAYEIGAYMVVGPILLYGSIFLFCYFVDKWG